MNNIFLFLYLLTSNFLITFDGIIEIIFKGNVNANS